MRQDPALLKKYDIRPAILSYLCFIRDYAGNREEPICFVRNTHEHRIEQPESYRQTTGMCTMFIFLSGKFGFLTENRVYNPAYGDVFLFRENESITSCFYTNSYVDYYEISFPVSRFSQLCDPNPIPELFYGALSADQNMISPDSHTKEQILSHLKEIEENISANSRYKEALAYAHLLQVMDILISCCTRDRNEALVSRIPAKLKMAIDYMHCNFATLDGCEEVAAHCGITGTYLSRIFRQGMGCSPNEYLTNLRISNAKYLLHTGSTLTDACYRSGFRNYSYFITKFKSATGVTPSKFYSGE